MSGQPRTALPIRVALLALASLAGPSPGSESQPGAEPPAIVKNGRLDLDAAVNYFENLYRSRTSRSRVAMTVVKPRHTLAMTLDVWTRGEDRALIIIRDPPRDQGIATLKVDKNLWNYMPRIKRTIRIPPSMMLGSWMGSDFTNDDLVRESSFRDDYAYSLAGPSGQPAGWIIRFDAKPGLAGLWQRIDLVVSEDGLLPLRGLYYNRRGELARVITWDDVTILGGRRLPARMTLVPQDAPGQSTVMVYRDIVFDAEVPESTFSLPELERNR